MTTATKYSLAATAGVLLVGSLLGLARHQELVKLRTEQHDLLLQADQLGVQLDSARSLPLSKRSRDSADLKTRSMVTQVLVFAKEMDSRRLQGSLSDLKFQKRVMEMNQRLVALSPPELQKVIAALLGENSLTTETRVNFIGSSILILSDSRPAEAVALYAESGGLLGRLPLGRHVISKALSRWAEQDPLAAQGWMRTHPDGYPGISEHDAQRLILAGTVKKSPALAIALLREMGFQDSSAALRTIVEETDSLEQRSAILAALREQKGVKSVNESLETMARSLKGESFETVQAWLNHSALNSTEKAHFAAGLTYATTQQDTGHWIDWMAQNLPSDQLRENVGNLIGQWTQQDYLAAGKWLTAAAAGPAKNAAIGTYAITVAEYEPQTAVQWGLTLPEGAERQATLQAILRNWPKKDAAAAALFAQEHRLLPLTK
jgi:hypothetical protein